MPSPICLCGKILLTPKLTSGAKERESLLLQEKSPCLEMTGKCGHTALQEPGCVGVCLSKLLQPLL